MYETPAEINESAAPAEIPAEMWRLGLLLDGVHLLLPTHGGRFKLRARVGGGQPIESRSFKAARD